MVKFPRRRGAYYYYLGERFVSVTNVLSMLAKPALITWAGKTTADLVLSDPERYDTVEKAISGLYSGRDKKGDIGTEVHSYAQYVAEGILEPGLARPSWAGSPEVEESKYRQAVDSFFVIMSPEVIFPEVNVYSREYKYAGTADLIAKIGGETWLIDYKTSKSVYPEMGLQLTAYKSAEFALIDGKEVELPKIDHTAVVLLKSTGQFIWHPVEGELEVFLALRQVWDWNQTN